MNIGLKLFSFYESENDNRLFYDEIMISLASLSGTANVVGN